MSNKKSFKVKIVWQYATMPVKNIGLNWLLLNQQPDIKNLIK